MREPRNLGELTTHCIRCGFCLEACPTFGETASELESPRGRIYLVRSALEGKLRWQEDVRPHLDRCLGCLACETACPSGVHYGGILEMSRDLIEQQAPDRAKSMLLKSTTNPSLLRAQLGLGRLLPGKKVPKALSRLLTGQAPEADRPVPQTGGWAPLDQRGLPAVRGQVYLLEGCAMRVLFPRVHQATRRLLRRVGFAVLDVPQGCCGALHVHNGHVEDARLLATELISSMPGNLPVVVNSAGCGSTMKEYGELLFGAGEPFERRVVDISEFLLSEGLVKHLACSPGLDVRLSYHDACHLAHGQGIRESPRTLLKAIPRVDFVELPEADRCCGSAGIYNVTQPKLARQLVERKMGNVESTQATILATGNPGCHAWIAQAAREHGGRVDVMHTAEVLELAFGALGA